MLNSLYLIQVIEDYFLEDLVVNRSEASATAGASFFYFNFQKPL